jgi:Fic family protein
LTEVSATLRDLKPIAFDAIDTAPDDRFSVLRHELSPHYVALHPAAGNVGRSRLEADALDAFEAGPDELHTYSPRGFRDQLGALNRTLTDGEGIWRTGFVKLGDDRTGNQIYFPPVSAVPGQLEHLRLFIASEDAPPPLFTAAVAAALLLNCHPFTDGNGRTARVFFNHLLRRDGMPADVYIPLYEIARRSHGGYEIALRQAEIRGEWEPFLRFMIAIVQCHRRVAVWSAHEPDARSAKLATAGNG